MRQRQQVRAACVVEDGIAYMVHSALAPSLPPSCAKEIVSAEHAPDHWIDPSHLSFTANLRPYISRLAIPPH